MNEKYITEEDIKKIQGTIHNKQYFCSYEFEEQVVKEMLDIVTNDENYQEFVKGMIQNKEN